MSPTLDIWKMDMICPGHRVIVSFCHFGIILLLVALVVALIPADNAASVEPVEAMRGE